MHTFRSGQAMNNELNERLSEVGTRVHDLRGYL